MAQQGMGTPGRGGGAGPTVLLPGLTDADLRTLRAMDDPELIAAVDRVLAGTDESQQVWHSGESERLMPDGSGECTFSAPLAESPPTRVTGR